MSQSTFIGITTYNDHGYLPLLLWTIRNYTFSDDYELVVCDDGSPNEVSAQSIKLWCEEYSVDLIRHEENKGISAAWNTLSNEAVKRKCKNIVLLSNDLLVVPHWLRCLLYALQANESSDIVGSVFWPTWSIPQCYSVDFLRMFHQQLHKYVVTVERVSDVYSKKQDDLSCRTAPRRLSPLGSAFAFTAKTLSRVGQFDERFQGSYNDMDFGVRCARLGLWSFMLPYPKLYHAFSRTYVENKELPVLERRDAGMSLIVEKWGLNSTAGYTYLHEQFIERYMRLPDAVEQQLMFLVPTGNVRETSCSGDNVALSVLEPMLHKVYV